jgi:hypothetical protein
MFFKENNETKGFEWIANLNVSDAGNCWMLEINPNITIIPSQ